MNNDYSIVEEIVSRNYKYSKGRIIEEQQEEEELLNSFDWQSPSDRDRWTNFQDKIEETKLKFIIQNSAERESEKYILTEMKNHIEEDLLKYKPTQPIQITNPTKTFLNRFNPFQKPQIVAIDLTKEIEEKKHLQKLLDNINKQLPFY